ncbi:heparanase-like protein 2 [Punica granatum]|uniref:Heparanase-like protein 2 n=1 Tax=Punica granatum TaxID=22663 RepID=A0A218WSR3_PUNGR|nr:heparanase-like protein 2 [Punica granatum]OWM75904.1 hypothetical protein CDL15_Pgr009548 [Punica granatum]
MGAESKVILSSIILVLWLSPLSSAEDVTVTVKSVTHIATTDDNFVCATLDWWPEDKCDYGQCPWGRAGILNLDLDNTILSNAIKAFNPLRIRVGGSLQDQVVYKINWPGGLYCPQFKKTADGRFGFSQGCLDQDRWDQIIHFLNKTGAVVTFGLNALYGKSRSEYDKNTYVGVWNPWHAHHLMKYTAEKGYKIDSYELGNELSGSGVSGREDAERYGKDMIMLKKIVNSIWYPDPSNRPKILGPGGFYDQQWFQTLLEVTGPGVIDVLTHHIYNLGPGVDRNLINKVQDPYFLDQVAQTYADVKETVARFGPGTKAWVGESGGAYNSGSKDVSHTFADGFWYLDQLGMTSTFDHKVFCRQSLIGGNYGLLNTMTFIPNPDYYGALLWHRLMGKNVLSITHFGSPKLRAYAHCSKQKPGVTMLLINMSNSTSFNVSVTNDLNLYPDLKNLGGGQKREEYHLTPKDGNIQSDVVLLNGTPLQLTESQDIPEMKPKLVDPSTPITIAPDSFVFVTIRDFNAPACA